MTVAAATIKERFSSEAANWDQQYAPEAARSIYVHNLRERRKTALSFIGSPDGRVLEIGCGAGNVILGVDTDRILGTDFALPMLHKARQSALRDRRPLKLAASDAASLPFTSESTDTAVALGVLEYLQRPSEALAELHRILTYGGTLVLSSPNALSPFVAIDDVLKGAKNWVTRSLMPGWMRRQVKSLLGKGDEDYFTHKRHRFGPGQIRSGLEDLGFEIVKERFHTFGFGVLDRSALNLSLCSKLEEWATTHPKLEKLGWTIVLKARKRS